MEIDDRKFAAFIRHFGEKFEEGGEAAYQLSIPLKEWLSIPKGMRVLPADCPSYFSGKESTVSYVAFVDPSA